VATLLVLRDDDRANGVSCGGDDSAWRHAARACNIVSARRPRVFLASAISEKQRAKSDEAMKRRGRKEAFCHL